MSRILGIDLGKSGALCILDGGIVLSLIPMPLDELKNIDLVAIVNYLEFYKPSKIFLEKVGSRPGQGVRSMYTFGFGTGAMYGIAASLKIPLISVQPQVWQRSLMGKLEKGVPHTKDITIAFCQKEYPLVSLLATPRSRVPSNGLADALAIATYGTNSTLQPSKPK